MEATIQGVSWGLRTHELMPVTVSMPKKLPSAEMNFSECPVRSRNEKRDLKEVMDMTNLIE